MIIIYILCTLLIIFLAVSFAVYMKAFYNGKRSDVTYKVLSGPDYDPYHDQMIDVIKTASKLPFEEITIKSYDGKKLYGRLYLKDPKAPFHIQFNGYRGNGLRDFSGGLQIAVNSGGNVILTDQRAHGKSDGSTITFGIKERKDVLSWAQYVCDKYGNVPIFLEGISMGAATVLMSSDLPLPDNVKGIIADCPYSNPFDIISYVSRKRFGVGRLLDPFIFTGALIFGRFNVFSASPLKAVKSAKVPVLIIHGTTDTYVPIEMSRAVRDANPDKITLIEVDDAPHGLSYIKDKEKYEKAVSDFISNL